MPTHGVAIAVDATVSKIERGRMRQREETLIARPGSFIGRMVARFRTALIVVLVLLCAAGAAYGVLVRPDLAAFASLGYAGIALLMFICSTTILLPAPGFAAVVAAGSVWNPLLVGVSAGIGGGLGEFSGYLLGLGGENLMGLERHPRWQTLSALVQKWGFIVILLGAATPFAFDLVGVVAGSARYPAHRFVVATMIGKVIKYLILAYFGDVAFTFWTGLST